MSIIAFVNQKGGCGKTSTAVHFARWLLSQGRSVALFDADIQASAQRWLNVLDCELPCFCAHSQGELIDQVSEVHNQFDFIVVDGPAKLSDVTRAILLTADIAIVPVQPSGLDIDSAIDAVKLIRQARKVRKSDLGPGAALFLSRAVKGSKLKQESTDVLKSFEDVPLLGSVIHQRQCIADCYGQAETVFTMAGRAAADSAREYLHLFTEIMELTNAST